MSTKETETGGPAFPVTFEHAECTSETQGMTLRDYFAAKAMTRYELHDGMDYTALANRCYQISDAMIAERSK